MILQDGLKLTATGVVLGLIVSAAFARLMTRLFGVGPLDFVMFSIAPLVLAAVVLLACWFPAIRATRVDPLVALRHD